MPEVVEVALTAEMLNNYLDEDKISKIVSRTEAPDLKGHIVKEINSKGKFLWFKLARGEHIIYLMSTLGLTGEWVIGGSDYPVFKIIFKSGKEITYSDMLRFGKITFGDKKDLTTKLNKLGPDLLKDNITFSEFTKIKKFPKKNIVKMFMNDQNIFSGIGNYLIAEILYKAKLSPHRIISELDDDMLKILYKSILYTIKRFYLAQGGEYDYYPQVKAPSDDTFYIYQNKKATKEKINGKRTIHWNPLVQKN